MHAANHFRALGYRRAEGEQLQLRRAAGGFYVAIAANVANIYAGYGIGATPDGRLAGEPLSGATSPTYGRNVRGATSREVPADAMEHPEHYQSPVVRVSGFSAYYVMPTRDVQMDILSETRQE